MTASIVLYNNPLSMLQKTITSVLGSSLIKKLYLIDNSPTDMLKQLASSDLRIVYLHNPSNPGFGAAHNIAIKKSIFSGSRYHLVLNPDIYFDSTILDEMQSYMDKHLDTGLLMPKVLYPNGELQKLCKLLPTPLDLFARRFILIKSIVDKINNRYELGFFNYEEVAEVPFLSGCFMFLRVDILKRDCLFDEAFFMYLEDADLSRRISRISKIKYYPYVNIYHEYQRGAHKNKKLLWFFIRSVFTYFSKYGWLFDYERKSINERALNRLGYYKK